MYTYGTGARSTTEILTQDIEDKKVSVSQKTSFGYQDDPIYFSEEEYMWGGKVSIIPMTMTRCFLHVNMLN